MRHNKEINMKACILTDYGSPDNFVLREVTKPSPGDGEVLVKVHAASINSWDWEILKGKPFINRIMVGLFKPTKMNILGCDIAGRIEAVGDKVKHFQVGDEVYGDTSSCGWGGFAEYVSVTEKANALALKPAGLSFVEAAAVPQAGVLAPLSFVLAALLAGLTAFSYAELSARFPLSAGEAVYVENGLRVRALAAVVLGDPVRMFLHIGVGILHGDRKADARHDWQVDHVITDVGYLIDFKIDILYQCFVGWNLVAVTLIDPRNAEVFHAVFNNIGFSAGNDGGVNAAFLQHAHTVTVERIEGLVFLAIIAQEQAAVRHDAVNVEYDELNFFCFV